jgi:hypothetical protein
MDVSTDLGQFKQRVEIDGATYIVKGLSVLEYIDLQKRVGHDLKQAFNTSLSWAIVKAGLEDWIGVVDEDGDPIEFHKEYVDELPDDVIFQLASIIYKDMSIFDDLTESKFRGHIRLIYYLSDETYGASRSKSFDCLTCVKNGWPEKRGCTLTYLDELKAHVEETKQAAEPVSDKVNAILDKRKKKKQSRKKFHTMEEYEASIEKDSFSVMAIPGFSYPECPISWIDPWIKTAADVLYDCSKSNKSLYNGGSADQSYFLYKAMRVVGSEASKVESEQMKKKK